MWPTLPSEDPQFDMPDVECVVRKQIVVGCFLRTPDVFAASDCEVSASLPYVALLQVLHVIL
jgi:hypothetical protein